jgi:hypothetical protein
MLVPKGSQELYVERNATAVLAVLALSSFMALTAMLMILSYDQAPDVLAAQGCPNAMACGLASREMPSD